MFCRPLFVALLSFSMFSEGSGSKEENCRRASLKVERERKLGKKQARQLCPGLLLAILGTAAVPGFFWFWFCVKAIDGGKGM